MNTANDNLTSELQSAVAFPMEQASKKTPAAGNRFAKLIKKGDNSKLPESLAVEVPILSPEVISEAVHYPAIKAYLVAQVEQLQNLVIKKQLEAGNKMISYSAGSIGLDAMQEYLQEQAATIGRIDEARVRAWFTGERVELLQVALADRLGITETATAAEVQRIEQVCNQYAGHFAKMAGRKPISFDSRVKDALNWALDITADGSPEHTFLKAKLNKEVDAVDFAEALGF